MLELSDESEPEPDVAIVALGRYADRHPDRALLVIEVADSSLEYDRDTKGPLYAASNVTEYWIVDIAGGCVAVYSAPADGRYSQIRRFARGEVLSLTAFPDVTLRVDDVVI